MALNKYLRTLWYSLIIAFTSLILTFALALPANAQDYSCGAYGKSDFGNGEVCGASTEVPSKDNGLINTGQALALLLPAVSILAGVILLIKSRRKTSNKQG